MSERDVIALALGNDVSPDYRAADVVIRALEGEEYVIVPRSQFERGAQSVVDALRQVSRSEPNEEKRLDRDLV